MSKNKPMFNANAELVYALVAAANTLRSLVENDRHTDGDLVSLILIERTLDKVGVKL